jgi:precorrin-2 dehydrogenase/sirohydrochlorin ferrochelatase
VKKGDLILAISTSGKSPAMARKMREDLQEFLGEENASLLDLAGEIRRELREQGVAVKGCAHCMRNHNDVWNASLDGEVKRMLAEGKRDEAKTRVLNLLLTPSGHEGQATGK